ncbi:hypothetical protein IscW_ISCW021916 [Ixodes scapularis]|uniref:Uncharacterized protein n=1 Tax=Ixodes scapularis TaxID=6945 RepID=B7QC52_IXOSC|nr:hypothetical protein IscW_ISCW021916 [Ixodes scapularis]|eukprot:XP_002413116.1 hypothetical protein IscW_ISCW021916 [Ixodes scapularis]
MYAIGTTCESRGSHGTMASSRKNQPFLRTANIIKYQPSFPCSGAMFPQTAVIATSQARFPHTTTATSTTSTLNPPAATCASLRHR